MSTPLISLLIPIYNVERYLRECLDSAANQTLSDIEIICINDGSTDSSPEIIREYMQKDSRFRMIDKPNSGYGASMNKGLDAATGIFVGILESDDFFEPDALQSLYEAAVAHDAQVAKANFWFYWSTPKPRNEFFEIVTPAMENRPVNPQEETEIFYPKNSIWSAIYRRDFLENNNIRFLETPGASYQDTAFDFKVWASAERVVYLSKAILHYRQDNETSSVNSPTKVYCVCDEYVEIERFLDEHPEKAQLKGVEEKMKYDSYMWNYDRLSEPLRAEFIKRFSEEFRRDMEAGVVDLDLFEWWKRDDLARLTASPELFHAQKTSPENEGLFHKIGRYYKIGGMRLLTRVAKERLMRH